MTVDMLAATFFWPEGTLVHEREDVGSHRENNGLQPSDQIVDPRISKPDATFWAAVLRRIGWPLPPKRPTLS